MSKPRWGEASGQAGRAGFAPGGGVETIVWSRAAGRAELSLEFCAAGREGRDSTPRGSTPNTDAPFRMPPACCRQEPFRGLTTFSTNFPGSRRLRYRHDLVQVEGAGGAVAKLNQDGKGSIGGVGIAPSVRPGQSGWWATESLVLVDEDSPETGKSTTGGSWLLISIHSIKASCDARRCPAINARRTAATSPPPGTITCLPQPLHGSGFSPISFGD